MDVPSRTTDHSIFEALYGRMLRPEGAFAADLRAAGYDPDHPRERYPSAVLVATLDVAHRHVYPALTREDAHRLLGRRFAAHFFGTMLGKIISGLLQALGLERFLMRLPKIVSLSERGLAVEVARLAPGELRIVYRGESLSPDFVAGALEGGGSHAGHPEVRAQVVRREPSESEMRVTGL